ncbi:ExbD/TolR family protein [Candidatus Latescibacterota bacterium]
MTPLIDCVFLLLIFFMVTTVFKNPVQLDMILPGAENSLTLDKNQLVAELDVDGNVALNGQVTSLEAFDALLVAEKQKTGTNSMVIRADVAAKHGNVLQLMKLAKGVGIATIAMAVEAVGTE